MPGNSSSEAPDAISSLVVEGFKSLAERTEIELLPLTLLAGANSSGKSSALQPLLLAKQTLESQFDPGGILLDGPNVSFTSAKQFLSEKEKKHKDKLQIGFYTYRSNGARITLYSENNGDFSTKEVKYKRIEVSRDEKVKHATLKLGMEEENIKKEIPAITHAMSNVSEGTWKVRQDRFFLNPYLVKPDGSTGSSLRISSSLSNLLQDTIHVPGLRDNPSRTYKRTAVGNRFAGTFDDYVASVIYSWQRDQDERLNQLVRQLQHLGLTAGIKADRVNDTQVELRVEQQPVASTSEGRMINVADVGLGVSQVLPVLAACLVANEGQLVYIEQPEIHLHPRAQTRLADVFVEAANRGVRIVLETHSQLLLLALQARIAEDQIDPERVMLHWFSRREDGVTEVDSQVPDEKGAFGDWPEDFSEVEMEAENRYLDAAERHLFKE
jgi:predicted ATPase